MLHTAVAWAFFAHPALGSPHELEQITHDADDTHPCFVAKARQLHSRGQAAHSNILRNLAKCLLTFIPAAGWQRIGTSYAHGIVEIRFRDGSIKSQLTSSQLSGMPSAPLGSNTGRPQLDRWRAFPHAPERHKAISLRLLDKSAINELIETGRVVLPNFASPDMVEALCRDQMALRTHGYGDIGEVEAGGEANVWRGGVEQIHLEANGAGPQRDDGEAAEYLSTEFVPTLMARLAPVTTLSSISETPAPFLPRAELTYLHYEPGGYYRPHIDTPEGMPDWFRRAFSFVLFLTSLGESDGGRLRLFPTLPDSEQQRRAVEDAEGRGTVIALDPVTDIRPTAGTLVLFQSDAVPHEVLETLAPRDALVGWLYRSYAEESEHRA